MTITNCFLKYLFNYFKRSTRFVLIRNSRNIIESIWKKSYHLWLLFKGYIIETIYLIEIKTFIKIKIKIVE